MIVMMPFLRIVLERKCHCSKPYKRSSRPEMCCHSSTGRSPRMSGCCSRLARRFPRRCRCHRGPHRTGHGRIGPVTRRKSRICYCRLHHCTISRAVSILGSGTIILTRSGIQQGTRDKGGHSYLGTNSLQLRALRGDHGFRSSALEREQRLQCDSHRFDIRGRDAEGRGS